MKVRRDRTKFQFKLGILSWSPSFLKRLEHKKIDIPLFFKTHFLRALATHIISQSDPQEVLSHSPSPPVEPVNRGVLNPPELGASMTRRTFVGDSAGRPHPKLLETVPVVQFGERLLSDISIASTTYPCCRNVLWRDHRWGYYPYI